MSFLAIFLLSALASADDLTTGKLAYSNGDFDRAVQEFRRAAQFNPRSSNAQLWLGRALGRKAEKRGPVKGVFFVGEIHRCFERAVELNPRSIDAREDLLEFYLQAPRILGGGLEKAREQAKAIGLLSSADGHAAWARIAEIHKDYQRAEEELRAAIASDGNKAGRYRELGLFFSRRGMLSDSEVAFLLAGDQQAQFYLAEAYVNENWKLADAEILLRKFLAAPQLPPGDDPTPADAHVLLGRVLFLRGQKGAAIEEFRRALLSNPESSEARVQLSRLGS